MKKLKAMKNIDEIIRNNREMFEDAEPSDGHFERFSMKLEMRCRREASRRSIVPYLLKAAVVTLLVTLSSLYSWEHFIKPERKGMTLGQVSPEYREVENYYIHQVNLMESEISSIELNDATQKTMLMQELKSMDSVKVSLQKELKANPNDERIISAMIEHYQTKLEVMTYIVSQLKAINNNNKAREDEKVSL